MSRTESAVQAEARPSPGLIAACESLGVNVRKHTPEIYGWSQRIATVVDLADAERQVLREQGPAALDEQLRQADGFLFPASDIHTPRPIHHATALTRYGRPAAVIVYPGTNRFYEKLARQLAELVTPALAVCRDDAFHWGRHDEQNVLVLGGSHDNHAALQLSCWQLNFLNPTVPGAGGWAVQTIHGLVTPKANVLVVAADRTTRSALLAAFRDALRETGDGVELARLDQVHLGPAAAHTFGEPEALLKDVAPRLDLSNSPTFTGFVDVLNAAFDSGGPEVNRDNGHCTIPAIIRAYYAYRCTGDPRFLTAFKATLRGLVTYFLATPGGASYPSDYDFYLGPLITCWGLAEAEACFTDAERLVVTNTLLASARMCEKFQQAKWPIEPNTLRHNHETFPALTSFWAARYFGGAYGIADASRWHQIARDCFTGPIEHCSRHKENANTYQWIVPIHKLTYDAAHGSITTEQAQIIRRTVQAIRVVTDNFGYGVPYGDAEPITGTTTQLRYLQAAAVLTGDREMHALADRCAAALRPHQVVALPQPALGTLLVPPSTHVQLRGRPAWEKVPMASHALERHRPNMPASYVWDKLAVRTGWSDADQYLLFEPYSCDSHAHRDMNAILSYNHRGRMWLVDNGYGKQAGVTDMSLAYRTREVGPHTHNTLLFRNSDGEIILPPPFAAVTACRRSGDLHLLQSTLAHIDGCTWQRTLLLKRDGFLLVIDRVLANANCRVGEVECQFNALGAAELHDDVWHLAQAGVDARLCFSGDGTASQGTYLTAGWQHALEELYPHADAPVKQLSRRARIKPGGEVRFISLFEAAAVPGRFAYALQQDRVAGPFATATTLHGSGLKLIARADELSFDFVSARLLPRGLSVNDFGK